MTASSRRASVRIDFIAATWGGLACAIAMMAGASRDLPIRVGVAVLGFFVGGFLAGVRASGRRMAHAAAAWTLGLAMFAVFVVLTAVASLIGGPGRPDPFIGGQGQTISVGLIALAAALAGGATADGWLRPRTLNSDRSRRKR